MPAATHVRRQIREAVATAVTGLTTTGTKVHQSRMRPQGDSALPCLLIETNEETVERVGDSGDLIKRTLDIVIRGHAKASANVDDTLDAIALEVETAIAATTALDALTQGVAELGGISIDFDELEKPVGVVSLRYSVLYITTAGSPGTPL